MANTVITIGRQFGSGGHKIGEYLANRLQIRYYDDELILLAAQRADLNVDALLDNDEMLRDPLRGGGFNDEFLFKIQREVIIQIAQRTDAVIVGRCADDILQKAGCKVLSVFIAAPLEQRIQRTMRMQGLSREEVEALTERMDRTRREYYERHTEREWGKKENYDLYYDTSEDDIGYIMVDIIKAYKELTQKD